LDFRFTIRGNAYDRMSRISRSSFWQIPARSPASLTCFRSEPLDEIRDDLPDIRATACPENRPGYLLKEAFQQLWEYSSPCWQASFSTNGAGKLSIYLSIYLSMRSRIEPTKKISRSLRQHRELILNYFQPQKSYGFRTYRILELPFITPFASCLRRISPIDSSGTRVSKILRAPEAFPFTDLARAPW